MSPITVKYTAPEETSQLSLTQLIPYAIRDQQSASVNVSDNLRIFWFGNIARQGHTLEAHINNS